ncbi:MAG: hypothetical protein LBK02_02555 [Treponema sp.]|nr:hypothetical protein [Treponema sp.]
MLKKLVRWNKPASYALFFIILPLFFSGCFGLFEEETEPGIAIETAEDLAKIGRDSEYPLNGNYHLNADIDLAAYDRWTPIGFRDQEPFRGIFDGRDKTIKNLRLGEEGPEETPLAIGLFGYTFLAKIQDLNIEIAEDSPSLVLTADLEQYVGALAGKAEKTMLFNITVLGKGISANKARGRTGGVYLGGIAGYLVQSTAERCDSRPALAADTGNGAAYAGGIAGYVDTSAVLQRNRASGDISAGGDSAYAGGIAGDNANGIIRDNYAAGDVSAFGISGEASAGGIAGRNSGAVRNTYAAGDVAAETGGVAYAGGIAGFSFSPGTIENSAARSALIKVTAPDPNTNRNAGRISGSAAGIATGIAFNGMEIEAYEDASSSTPSTPSPGVAGDGVSMEALQNRRAYAENGLGWDFDILWDWDPAEKTPKIR